MAKTTKTTNAQAPVAAGYVPDLKKVYKEEIVAKLMKEFSYSTVMQVPRLVKITINQGIEEARGCGSAGIEHNYRTESGYNRIKERYFKLQTP